MQIYIFEKFNVIRLWEEKVKWRENLTESFEFYSFLLQQPITRAQYYQQVTVRIVTDKNDS
jgi:hypothetical protein